MRRSARWGGVAAVMALASGAMLIAAPAVALIGAPFAFGGTDGVVTAMFGDDEGPPGRRRVTTRAVVAVVTAGVLGITAMLRQSARAAAHLPWILPLLGVALATAAMIGTWGSAGGARRGPAAEGPAIGALDVATTVWCFMLSRLAQEASFGGKAVLTMAAATALLTRATWVAALVRLGLRTPWSGGLAAVGFVAWLAGAAIASVVASTAIAYSGLGAAAVLAIASVAAELRRKRAAVALVRASLGCAVSTMVSLLSLLLA